MSTCSADSDCPPDLKCALTDAGDSSGDLVALCLPKDFCYLSLHERWYFPEGSGCKYGEYCEYDKNSKKAIGSCKPVPRCNADTTCPKGQVCQWADLRFDATNMCVDENIINCDVNDEAWQQCHYPTDNCVRKVYGKGERWCTYDPDPDAFHRR